MSIRARASYVNLSDLTNSDGSPASTVVVIFMIGYFLWPSSSAGFLTVFSKWISI